MTQLRTLRVLAITSFVVALLALPTPSASARVGPSLRGRIVSGVLSTSPAWECALEPDCAPWLASGCDPALATQGPAWLTAIVDVASLADGVTRRAFTIRRGPAGLILGGAHFQFWTADCKEVDRISWHTFWQCQSGRTAHGFPCEKRRTYDALGSHVESVRATFPLPANVAWMTISANDNVNVRWSVT